MCADLYRVYIIIHFNKIFFVLMIFARSNRNLRQSNDKSLMQLFRFIRRMVWALERAAAFFSHSVHVHVHCLMFLNYFRLATRANISGNWFIARVLPSAICYMVIRWTIVSHFCLPQPPCSHYPFEVLWMTIFSAGNLINKAFFKSIYPENAGRSHCKVGNGWN